MPKFFLAASEHIVPILDVVPTTDRKGITHAAYLGTGVFVKPGCLLTCKHVLENAKNIRCVVSNVFAEPSERVIAGIGYIKTHKFADIAIANVKDDIAPKFKPLPIDFLTERYLGREVINFSYLEDYEQGYMVTTTPRLFKGYIMRTSVERRNKECAYVEVNFPALRGMSGSPILDNNEGKILGIIYENYRSQVLEDVDEEYELSNGVESLKETVTTFKVVEYGKAVDLSKYKSFFEAVLP